MKNLKISEIRRVVREELMNFGKVFRDKTVDFISNSFAFVTALSWNETIKTYIQEQFIQISSVKLLYSIVVTLVSIVAIYILQKIKNPKLG